MKLTFKVLGIPKPKQSAKFTKKGFSYQPAAVKDMERNFRWDITSQLPSDFVPFDCPISLGVTFVFPAPKSWSKKQTQELNEGKKIYKTTKPDLQDNLMKGICDAMNGVVYIDDSRICKLMPSEKIYGLVPMTLIEIEPIN